jgi:putative Mg2+ transporter-C (MgtC) family protein
MTELSFDWNLIVSNLVLMSVAYVLAIPIGWNREANARSAGLRTYPLVAVATCAMMLIGIKVMDSTGAEARVMQAIITGMGFIGGGAILKTDNRVTGLATASSLWATGAMGMAVAWQRYEIALLVCVLTFATLQFGSPAKKMVNGDDD